MVDFGMRRAAVHGVALILASGLLAVVGGATTSASAAIVCRETFAGPPLDFSAKNSGDQPFAGASNVAVSSERVSATVRVTLDLDISQASNLQVFVYPPTFTGLFNPNSQLFQTTSGSMTGTYTFDDLAAVSIDGANRPPGLYKPHSPLSILANQDTKGTWGVWVNNYGGPAGKLRAVSLTITYAGCPDANGDGLHDDADGDGVLFPPDNCADVVNADQLDSDVDGIGNACDPTPFLPPPPPVGQPGPREVSLRYAKKLDRLKGSVSSPVGSCESKVRVELWKRRSGEDRRLPSMTTKASGTFRTPKVRRPGTYYVTVGSAFVDLGAVECVATSSRAVRVRR